VSDAAATIIAATAALVGAAVGFVVRWALERRSRWDVDRHRAFVAFYVSAYAVWDCIDADGNCDADRYTELTEEMRAAYAAAMFICRRSETSDALDAVHDALGKLFLVVAPREEEPIQLPEFRQADREVHNALAAFTNTARGELGLEKLEQSSYDDWVTLWRAAGDEGNGGSA
jgi:hypothetical protein